MAGTPIPSSPGSSPLDAFPQAKAMIGAAETGAAIPAISPSGFSGAMSRSAPFLLPSKGLMYGDRLIGGEITVGQLRGRHEEDLANLGGTGSNPNAIFHVMNQVIGLPPTMTHDDLLMDDWTAAMLEVLKFSYGSKPFRQPVQCPSCAKHYALTVKVEDTKVRPIEESKAWDVQAAAPVPSPYTFVLPSTGQTVRWRKLTVALVKRWNNYVHQQQSSGKTTKGMNYARGLHLVEVDGKPLGEVQAMHFVDDALPGDLRALAAEQDTKQFGPEMEFHTECVSCFFSFNAKVQLDAAFFRGLST